MNWIWHDQYNIFRIHTERIWEMKEKHTKRTSYTPIVRITTNACGHFFAGKIILVALSCVRARLFNNCVPDSEQSNTKDHNIFFSTRKCCCASHTCSPHVMRVPLHALSAVVIFCWPMCQCQCNMYLRNNLELHSTIEHYVVSSTGYIYIVLLYAASVQTEISRAAHCICIYTVCIQNELWALATEHAVSERLRLAACGMNISMNHELIPAISRQFMLQHLSTNCYIIFNTFGISKPPRIPIYGSLIHIRTHANIHKNTRIVRIIVIIHVNTCDMAVCHFRRHINTISASLSIYVQLRDTRVAWDHPLHWPRPQNKRNHFYGNIRYDTICVWFWRRCVSPRAMLQFFIYIFLAKMKRIRRMHCTAISRLIKQEFIMFVADENLRNRYSIEQRIRDKTKLTWKKNVYAQIVEATVTIVLL